MIFENVEKIKSIDLIEKIRFIRENRDFSNPVRGKHTAMGVEHSPWPGLRVVPRCWLSPEGVSSVAASGPQSPLPSVPIMHSPPAALPPGMH